MRDAHRVGAKGIVFRRALRVMLDRKAKNRVRHQHSAEPVRELEPSPMPVIRRKPCFFCEGFGHIEIGKTKRKKKPIITPCAKCSGTGIEP